MFIRVGASIALLLGISLIADASCRVVHRQAAAVVAVVNPVAVAAFVPVAVPAYGVGYAGDDRVEKMIAELREEMKAYLPQKAAAASGKHPGAVVLETRCAKCHTGEKANGGFSLDLTKMNEAKTAFRVTKEIFSGRMPKGGKLSDTETQHISDYLDTLK